MKLDYFKKTYNFFKDKLVFPIKEKNFRSPDYNVYQLKRNVWVSLFNLKK